MNSPLKHLDPIMQVSDCTLSSIVTQLGYCVREAPSNGSNLGEVELKYMVAKSRSKCHTYIVGFAFERNCAGKLIRMTSKNVHDMVAVITYSIALNSESTIILIGKKGSRKDNRFAFISTPGAFNNVVVREFTSHDNILSYLSNIISDIDKTESRRVRDPVRADMAVIQQSEKCIKINPQLSAEETRTIVFANQLLQIPGMTEKLARAIAGTFRTPKELTNAAANGAGLREFTFIDSRNLAKRINSRLLAVLEKLFNPEADPHSCIW